MLTQNQRDRGGHDLRRGDGITLIPYAQVNGAWTLPDNAVEALWVRLCEDGIDGTVFPEGDVLGSGEFLELMQAPGNVVVFPVAGDEVIGAAWLNNIRRNHAFAHFFFYRASWGAQTLKAGVEILRYWWAFRNPLGMQQPLFKTLVGNIPAWNKLARGYVRRLGFHEVGQIPHIANGDPMVIHYMERPE